MNKVNINRRREHYIVIILTHAGMEQLRIIKLDILLLSCRAVTTLQQLDHTLSTPESS